MVTKMSFGVGLVGLALFAQPVLAQSPVIEASATSTNAGGGYTYDFTFTSNLCCGTVIYKLGVFVDGATGQGSPAGWSPNGSQNNSGFGGSNITYNDSWQVSAFPTGAISTGQTVGGFTVTSSEALSSINWFAFGVFGNYTGGGSFYNPDNPGFEGIIDLRSKTNNDGPRSTSTAVPEAASWALMLMGFGGIGAALRRRQETKVRFG